MALFPRRKRRYKYGRGRKVNPWQNHIRRQYGMMLVAMLLVAAIVAYSIQLH